MDYEKCGFRVCITSPYEILIEKTIKDTNNGIIKRYVNEYKIVLEHLIIPVKK